ncbi:MAG TPA: histidine kinase [Bacteroidia bacterium]|nr:histidine kinase [Bacteroidia bacterium]
MNERLPYSFARILIAYLSWWIFWAAVQTAVLRNYGLDWHVAAADALVSNLFLAIGGYIVIIIYRYYQPGKKNRIYHFIFGIAITILVCLGIDKVLGIVFPEHITYQHFLDHSSPVRFIFSLLVIYFIILLNWLWNSLLEQKENLNRKVASEELLKEAELIKLRQQLQPHFLFNSLNSISALVIAKPQEARKMVQQLSDFLRGTLKKEDQLVSLKEELEHLKLYLDIEKVRFGHRLSVEFNTPDESLSQLLPALLLQPIVENAIKFGLYDTIGETKISVEARQLPDHLLIEVKNPFDEATAGGRSGTGFGLASIQRRLYLLYARQDLLSTQKSEAVFTTTLKIPIR